jgi:cell wall-associated NlpC family hydrolase
MTDPRQTPDPAVITRRDPARITQPVTDLCRSAAGPRDRQLLYGDAVTILNDDQGWCYVQAKKDGYCGHVPSDSLGPPASASHLVTAPATHADQRADFKSPDLCSLSHGSQVEVEAKAGKFAQTTLGFIPLVHLAPIGTVANDPADIAALFLGTPYLWGGNSRWGIDCSGLVQAALLACGIPCPGDSDQQHALGQPASAEYRRNDLLFWKGHVALVVDGKRLIHANAATMSVVYESIEEARQRISDQGDGAVTAHRRF